MLLRPEETPLGLFNGTGLAPRRENNVDNNTTGWYQSSGDGGWQTQELVKTFLDFSASIKRCVAVVYDHQLAAVGQLPLHAVVVSPKFAEVTPSPTTARLHGCTATQVAVCRELAHLPRPSRPPHIPSSIPPPSSQVFKKGVKSLTFEKLQEAGVTFGDVFTEIPIEVTNNPLTCALLSDLR